jgi:hypothetical protein
MVERQDVEWPIVSDVHVNSPGCGFPQLPKTVEGGSSIERGRLVAAARRQLDCGGRIVRWHHRHPEHRQFFVGTERAQHFVANAYW